MPLTSSDPSTTTYEVLTIPQKDSEETSKDITARQGPDEEDSASGCCPISQ